MGTIPKKLLDQITERWPDLATLAQNAASDDAGKYRQAEKHLANAVLSADVSGFLPLDILKLRDCIQGRPFGSSELRISIARELERGPSYANDLARELERDKTTIGRSLERLERDGIVEQCEAPEDAPGHAGGSDRKWYRLTAPE